MKIPEQIPPNSIGPDEDCPVSGERDGKFARKLQEKLRSTHSQEGVPVLPGPPTINSQFEAMQNNRTEAATEGAGAAASKIDLSREIVQELEGGGRGHAGTVEIVFDSTVMDGLQVRICRENGAVNIDFRTKSETVAALLAERIPELSRRLGDHGLVVGSMVIRNQAGRNIGADAKFVVRDRRAR